MQTSALDKPNLSILSTRQGTTLQEPPPNEEYYDEAESTKGAILCTVRPGLSSQLGAGVLTCFSSSSQLMRTAAFLYFRLSSRNRLDMSPMRSRLSPRYSRSSMFLVMTLVTSLSSLFSLSRFWVARVSWYVSFVCWMYLSKPLRAYGRRVGLL